MLKREGCNDMHSRHIASSSPFALKLVEDQTPDHGGNDARDDGKKKFAHRRCSHS
jgi:hypothetical protein